MSKNKFNWADFFSPNNAKIIEDLLDNDLTPLNQLLALFFDQPKEALDFIKYKQNELKSDLYVPRTLLENANNSEENIENACIRADIILSILVQNNQCFLITPRLIPENNPYDIMPPNVDKAYAFVDTEIKYDLLFMPWVTSLSELKIALGSFDKKTTRGNNICAYVSTNDGVFYTNKTNYHLKVADKLKIEFPISNEISYIKAQRWKNEFLSYEVKIITEPLPNFGRPDFNQQYYKKHYACCYYIVIKIGELLSDNFNLSYIDKDGNVKKIIINDNEKLIAHLNIQGPITKGRTIRLSPLEVKELIISNGGPTPDYFNDTSNQAFIFCDDRCCYVDHDKRICDELSSAHSSRNKHSQLLMSIITSLGKNNIKNLSAEQIVAITLHTKKALCLELATDEIRRYVNHAPLEGLFYINNAKNTALPITSDKKLLNIIKNKFELQIQLEGLKEAAQFGSRILSYQDKKFIAYLTKYPIEKNDCLPTDICRLPRSKEIAAIDISPNYYPYHDWNKPAAELIEFSSDEPDFLTYKEALSLLKKKEISATILKRFIKKNETGVYIEAKEILPNEMSPYIVTSYDEHRHKFTNMLRKNNCGNLHYKKRYKDYERLCEPDIEILLNRKIIKIRLFHPSSPIYLRTSIKVQSTDLETKLHIERYLYSYNGDNTILLENTCFLKKEIEHLIAITLAPSSEKKSVQPPLYLTSEDKEKLKNALYPKKTSLLKKIIFEFYQKISTSRGNKASKADHIADTIASIYIEMKLHPIKGAAILRDYLPKKPRKQK